MASASRLVCLLSCLLICACGSESDGGGGEGRSGTGGAAGGSRDAGPDAAAPDGSPAQPDAAGPGVAGAGGMMSQPPTGEPPDGCELNADDVTGMCPFVCPETCNDRDDDCDGFEDEGPAHDQCAAQHADAVCQDGLCLITTCLDGHRDCDDEASTGCEAPPDDVRNCGGCGTLCAATNAVSACVDAGCVVDRCLEDFADCDDDPLDCETSLLGLKNCTACGTICTDVPHALPSCNTGVCGPALCLGNFGDCNQEPTDGCEQRLTSVEHCGECGRSCALAGSVSNCTTGVCVALDCEPGHDECDGNPANGCEPLNTDEHCGGCGASCDPGLLAHVESSACNAMQCEVSECAPGYGDCDGMGKTGCETSLDSNTHCTDCNTPCEIDQAVADCSSGTCEFVACKDGWGDCNDELDDGCEQSLDTLTHCGDCDVPCNLDSCAGGICTAVQCTGSMADCDMDMLTCEIDVASDILHCGKCDSPCMTAMVLHATAACVDSKCEVTCDEGFGDCDDNAANGCEQELNTTAHCTECDKACAPPTGTPDCSSGSCEVSDCPPDRADCDDDGNTGCETLLNSTMNCGACMMQCDLPNAVESCGGEVSARVCEVAVCDSADFDDCDLQDATGCEADLRIDTAHCGMCNNDCEKLREVDTAHCTNSACAIDTCNLGWGDCDPDVLNGCEQPLNTTAYCGSCTNDCDLLLPGTQSTVCNLSLVCEVSQCESGLLNCDDPTNLNGCETDMNTTADCGGCSSMGMNDPCDGLDHVTASSCPAGDCIIDTCETDFDDCDLDTTTGCERDLATDPAHCGSCGHDCESLPQVMTAHCTGKTCVIDTCESGFGACDVDLDNGCEQPLNTPSYCGSCFNDCDAALPNTVSTACTDGMTCEVMMCADGHADCDEPADLNGCETDIHTTADCGGCANLGMNDPCEGLDHVTTSSCAAGDCVIEMCDAGFDDCDGESSNGCEQELAVDGPCCVPGTDTDMDGTDDCIDECDSDPLKIVPGDCGCADTPEMMGTPCSDGACAANVACDGAGRCGAVAECVVPEGTWVTTDYWHGCGIQNGQAHCWGNNLYGQLGDTTLLSHNTPEPVSGLSDAVQISARGGDTLGTSCAVRSGGGVKCWGFGSQGNLGDGTNTLAQPTPVSVMNLTDAIQVSVSNGHACAVRMGGQVVCWGSNGTAQLGDGTVNASNVPVTVMNLSDAIQVSTAPFHSCAVRTGGGVRCWGWRANGRIGDGMEFGNAMTATDVIGISDGLQVSAGDSHTCVVHQDGDVSCWGANTNGQLGDGTTTQRLSPTAIFGLSALQVSAGYRHSCAVLADGTAACWGLQSNGRLGNNVTGGNALNPDAVHNLTELVQIVAGYWSTCAATVVGDVYCWGEGQQGLLGTGSTADAAEPSGPLVFP